MLSFLEYRCIHEISDINNSWFHFAYNFRLPSEIIRLQKIVTKANSHYPQTPLEGRVVDVGF